MLVTFVMLPAAPASVAFVVFGGGARGGMNGGGTLGGVSGGNNALPLAPVSFAGHSSSSILRVSVT